MTRYFRCQHCGQMQKQSKRLKRKQKYCSSRKCQQSRRNLWEREKVKEDTTFRENRKKDKARWYEKKPGHFYQKAYRQQHPMYENENKDNQQKRYQEAMLRITNTLVLKVIKDEPIRKGNNKTGEKYKVLFDTKEFMQKIVKTDTLIVEMHSP